MPATPLSLFAITAPGLESLAARELAALGFAPRVDVGGVGFESDAAGLARASLELRTASRIVLRVGEFRAAAFRELERHAGKLAWSRFVARGSPVRFRVTCRKSRLYHSDAVAQRLHEAAERVAGARIATGARSAEGQSDEDDATDDAQLFVVRVVHDQVTVSADTSGALLHRRGYRQAVAKAPLRETLAAALLLGADWNPGTPLIDPFCGAGTILIEGALLARRIAPGIARASREPRDFAFRRWPDHDRPAWERAVNRTRETILPRAPAAIVGGDRDAGAVAATAANAARAGVAEDVHVTQRTLSDGGWPEAPGWLVTNPPYGVRVGDRDGLRNLYAQLGTLSRARLPGWRVALLSADPRLDAQLGLALPQRWRTSNGGIPVRLISGPVTGSGA
ncbi:MAG: RNA methyltransferase [Gemmatimonadaceae bacterium]